MTLKISQSSVKAWRKCRRSYHYAYVELLRRKKTPKPFAVGDLLHRMFDRNLEGKNYKTVIEDLSLAEMNLFESEREEYGDIVGNTLDIMAGYLEYYKDDGVQPIEFRGKVAEHQMEITLAPGIILTGKADWMLRTRNNRRWLSDHKTGKKQLSDSQMWRNVQSTVYHRMLDELGMKPLDGTMWDLVWSKPPSEPKINKNGSLSKAALVTLPVVVRRFLRDHKNLDKNDVAELLAVAKACEPRYYSRVFMPRNKAVERTLIRDFTTTAKEIARGHGKRRGRNLDWHCDSCQFNSLCQAKLLGLDYGFIKRTQYKVEETAGGSLAHVEEEDDE